MIQHKLFDKPIIITKENFKNTRIQSKLNKLHLLDQIEIRKEDLDSEKKRHKKILKDIVKLEKWKLLVGIANGLGGGHNGNLFPFCLFEFYAPLFFKKFDSGKIWFLPLNQKGMKISIKDERKLADRYKPDKHPLGFSQSFGLGFDDMLYSIGLEIPMFIRFPFYQGSITGSMSGIACFTIDKPLSMYDDNWNLHGFLMDKISRVYTDSNAEPYSNPRPTFQKLNMKKFSNYFEWYVESLNRLFNFVFSMRDLEKRRLIAFSLARICLDTYLVQIFEQPYLQKMLFFTLLDKYANLVNDMGSRKGETVIWKELLSITFFESKLKQLTKNVPKSLETLQGSRFILKNTVRQVLHSKYDTLIKIKAHEDEALEYLRTYRNSHHGYLLNSRTARQRFLKHTGEIPNYLPGYSIDLWHTFLTDPKKFVKILK